MHAAPGPPPVARRIAYAAEVVALATLYVAAARAGLGLDAVAGFATLVWAPTGIAMAALLARGHRLWPGVLLGALTANVWAGAPLLVALGIAAGNTLEGVLGAGALRRIPGFRRSLDRLRDALALVVLAAGLSTTVSATIGVASLTLGGIVSPAQLGETWRAWWLGDVMGALLVAPVLLVWSRRPRTPFDRNRVVEAVGLGTAAVVVGVLIFGGRTATEARGFGEAYMIFPVLIWAALRFGQRGAVTTAFVVSVIAVVGTVMGHGPFVRPALRDSLFALQAFMAVTAATFLVLGASISERRAALEGIRRAHETAAAANRAKSEFLAVMSHELRTPLNAISGYVELMSLGVAGGLTEKQREALSRIQRSQQHLLSLIDDVLSFARIEVGHISLAMQPVLVRDVLAVFQPLLEPELRRKDLTLIRDGWDPSLSVQADPEKLHQILRNFLANAVKFTAPGGRITVGAERGGDLVRIWVADTGIGIPENQLGRVFEPFFQVEHGTTRRYGGVGLGLSIARDLARAMEGDVRLESRVGEGSTVTLLLRPSDVPPTQPTEPA
ncbi:MAG: sensor histidine kinase [Gemmatimonadaceae bacterium]